MRDLADFGDDPRPEPADLGAERRAMPGRVPEGRLPTIRDSIHKTIPVEPFVHDLIATPQLQRMRRIRQLGGVHLVYPGANHSRFEHALGAYALARHVTRKLGLEEEDAKVVMAGALLHDVGHGPFSHTSEELLIEAGRTHEDLTVDLVQWSGVRSVLDRHDIPVQRVVAAVQGEGPYGKLVSGDLDVDRMDYLVRDAHYTGLETGVDPERIATGLEVADGEVVLHERSLVAAESLFVTRFMMYPAVYLHHTCRAIERMVVGGLHALRRAERIKVEDLERLDDARLIHRMHEGPEDAAVFARRLEERDLYKRALEGTMRVARDAADVLALTKDIPRRRALEDEIAQAAGVESHEVLIDVPPRTLMKPVGIRVLRRDGGLEPFTEASSLGDALVRATEDHWRFWVFAPRAHTARVGEAACDALGLDPKTVHVA